MQNFDQYFPQDSSVHYLNHAAVSPWPICSQEALTKFAEENTTHGATHYAAWMKVEQDCKQQLARLIGLSDTREIALAKSTSEALSIIAYGIKWKEGDEVIVTSHEFPSNRIVWESLSRFGVKLKIANLDNADPIQAISAELSDNTKLVSVSSVQYASGIKTDLKALSLICQKHDILLCIDAIQSLGAIPFDQKEIQADFIVADGHKWMMAAEGLALLYVKEKVQDNLTLHQFGWHMIHQRGNYDSDVWEPAHDASRFECGSPNMLGIHVLNASLGFIHEIGMDTIHSELTLRMDYLEQQIRERLPQALILSPQISEHRGGIFTFKPIEDGLKGLHNELMKKGVICAYRGGGIRFSPHFYTKSSTIDKAIDIVTEVIG